MYEYLIYSDSSLVLDIAILKSHSNRYVVVFHCDFNLHFPNDWLCEASFHVFDVHTFFGEVSLQVVCLFSWQGAGFPLCYSFFFFLSSFFPHTSVLPKVSFGLQGIGKIFVLL